MAQMTGTQILDYASLLSQNGDAVGDSDALLMLNDVLLRWERDIEPPRVTNLAASASGCVVPAGSANVVLTDATIEDIISLHPSASDALSYPLSPPLGPRPISNEEMWALYDRTPLRQTVSPGNEWAYWSLERSAENSDFFNIFVYPALTTTGYATLKVTKRVAISALTETPNISYHGGRIVARFLAYELAHVQKQNDEQWLSGLFRAIPNDVMNKWFGEARFQAAVASSPRSTGIIAG